MIVSKSDLVFDGDTIIFIDIDGPLLPARMHYQEDNINIIFKDELWFNSPKLKCGIKFDPVMSCLLNKWCQVTEAKFVISSSWTKYSTLEELVIIFKNNGIDIVPNLHKNWKTEKVHKWSRGAEIAQWLKENKGTVKNYLVLDDDDDVMSNEYLDKDKILLIDFFIGISFMQIFKGNEILGITDYSQITNTDNK